MENTDEINLNIFILQFEKLNTPYKQALMSKITIYNTSSGNLNTTSKEITLSSTTELQSNFNICIEKQNPSTNQNSENFNISDESSSRISSDKKIEEDKTENAEIIIKKQKRH
jgi:hypothetical protein